MKQHLLHIMVLLASLAPGYGAYSQDIAAAHATVDRNRILIGEPIALTLEVHLSPSASPRWFALDTIPHFEFVSIGALDSSITGGEKIYRQQLVITSFDSGSRVIPAMAMDLGKTSIMTDSIPVEVAYVPFDPKKDYHDIKDIISVENPYVKYLVWVIGAIALIALAAVIFFVNRRAIPGELPVTVGNSRLSPYEEAKQALADLRAAQLPQKGQSKAYYTRLNDILRLFVLRKLQIHSLEKTNEELIDELRRMSISPDLVAQLSAALRIIDFVKFAKYQPDRLSDDQHFRVIDSSVDLLNEN